MTHEEIKNKEIEIPKGYEARIEDNKVIIELADSEDEKIRKALLRCCDDWEKGRFGCMAKEDIPTIRAYLEKQKDNKFAPRVLPCSAAWFEDGEEKQKEQNLSHIEDIDYEENFDLSKNAVGMIRDGAAYYMNNRSRMEVLDWLENVPKIIKQLTIKINELEKQKEQKPDIELIQCSWYMEGYHDRKFDNEPKWIIKTEEGGPKYELNPKYGQPLAEEQKPTEWSKEDEGMINCIISTLCEESHGGRETNERMVNWLECLHERLKSLRPQPKQEWSEEDEHCIELLDTIIDSSSLIPKNRIKCHTFLKSLRPQPKQEWSEEDEKMIKVLDSIIRYIVKVVDKDVLERFGTNYEELFSWFKFLRPQPKQEWSEEDEKNIEKLDGFLREAFCYGHVYVTQEDKEELQSWLKFLRPQYHGDVTMTEAYKMGKEAGEASHWKPSWEQMAALFNASAAVYSEKEQKALESLYSDLSKSYKL